MLAEGSHALRGHPLGKWLCWGPCGVAERVPGFRAAPLLPSAAPGATGSWIRTGLHSGRTEITGCVCTPCLCTGFCISTLKFMRLEMRSLWSPADGGGRP